MSQTETGTPQAAMAGRERAGTAGRMTRRGLLGAMLASAAVPSLAPRAFAEAPATSPWPEPRPGSQPGVQSGREARRIIEAAKLGGITGYVLADARSGEVLEAEGAETLLPPASVEKTITSLYALEKLGADHRFVTRVMATAPIRDGRLDGDLLLAGGGDPTLDTDMLGDMAAALRAAGLRQVTGRFIAVSGALPSFERIADDQPDQVGYNPGLSGLILNFGRVYFEWKRPGGTLTLTMDARGERFAPPVQIARIAAVDRASPLFTFARDGDTERWTVARPALTKDGSRWLPVRQAAPYVAETFQVLCAAQGIGLPKAEIAASLPAGAAEILRHESRPLTEILRDMLRYSTNVTAEAVGLTASGAGTLTGSARAMQEWAEARLGLSAHFVDHSGLGAAARVTPGGMVRALIAGRATRSGAALPAILRDMGMRDAEGKQLKSSPTRVPAKTGTLNFASGLAGFIQPPKGRELAFAIFSADVPRREALPLSEREEPKGGPQWVRRARTMQGQLISRWATTYGV